MPRTWIALGRLAFPDTHVINPIPPVGRTGIVTFGTANNPYKYSPEMLRGWAEIVNRVPGSRFLFVRPEGGSQAFRGNIRKVFQEAGVSPDRVLFNAVRAAHMPVYNDIDIALDTFPQTGGTTTCEAAWMGVPTVSLVGHSIFERLSYSILSNAGLPDLCAQTYGEYVEIAVKLAADRERLQALRTGLRDQLKASPLGQTEQFAKDFYDLVSRTVESRLGVRKSA
jgi:predicted O-linked N-acetylglucosamine transferase (SPINDLY family)